MNLHRTVTALLTLGLGSAQAEGPPAAPGSVATPESATAQAPATAPASAAAPASVAPSAPSAAAAAVDPAAPPAGREFRLQVWPKADAPPRVVRLSLVTKGSTTVGKDDVTAYAFYQGGAPLTDGAAERLGLSFAPFTVFATTFQAKTRKDGVVELTVGESVTSFPAPKRKDLGARPKSFAKAGSYGFREDVGGHPSLCVVDSHPSPDSGDFFLGERCWAPGVGLTRMRFDSVWGRFELDLPGTGAGLNLPLE